MFYKFNEFQIFMMWLIIPSKIIHYQPYHKQQTCIAEKYNLSTKNGAMNDEFNDILACKNNLKLLC